MNFRRTFTAITLFIFISLQLLAGKFLENDLEVLANSAEWKNLLLMGDRSPDVIDPNFYATTLPVDPLIELTYLLENQNLSLMERFPARYDFISRHLDLHVPFEESDILTNYLSEMQFDSISLFFASPYFGSSMSYFGHTFLRLNKVGNEMFSKTINFVGDIPEDISFASLAAKGLSGKLKGTYVVKPFYLIFQKYSEIEQRLLLDYQIHVSEEDKRSLLFHLFELKDIGFDYSFIFNNCSSGLISLLQVIMPEFDLHEEFNNIVYPYDLPITLLDMGVVTPTRAIHPKLENLLSAYEGLSFRERIAFISLRNGKTAKTQAIANMDDGGLADKFSYLLNGLYDLQFKVRDSYEDDYVPVKNLIYPPQRPFADSTNVPLKNKLSTISLRATSGSDLWSYSVSFTPLSTKLIPYRFSQYHTGYFEVGKFELSYSNAGLKIDSLHFFEFESLSVINPFLNKLSKKSFIGFGYDDTYDTFRGYAEFGAGGSIGLFKGFLYVMPSFSLTANPFDIGISSLIGYKLDFWKLSLRIESTLPLLSINQSLDKDLSVSLTSHINDRISIEGSYEMFKNQFDIGLQYSFR